VKEITSLRLHKDTNRIVLGTGQIIREIECWKVSYTLSEPGWVDLERQSTHSDLADAHNFIVDLLTGGIDS
jgi:hypothetical protein